METSKKHFFGILFIIGIISSSFAQKKTIKIQINGLNNDTCYLSNYFGDKQYYKDTAIADAKGNITFSSLNYDGGIYSVIIPGMKYFEMIVNEPKIVLATDTNDLIKNMNVIESKENKIFFEHLHFIGGQQEKSKPWSETLKDEKANDKNKEKARAELTKIDDEVKKYRIDLIENNKELFISKMFNAMREPIPPAGPEGDKTFAYRYFKGHYWDNIDFKEERLIRTPIYHNKLKKYFEQLIAKHPDSIIVAADYVIEKARANRELFKYTVHYITNTYEKSKIMGMDAVFAHMGTTYYTKDQAYWVDSTQLHKIRERAEKITPLLIGKTAIDLALVDTTNTKWHRMSDIKTDYTVLIFWDPDCGHCKKEMPKLTELLDEMKDKSLTVFAVSSSADDKWRKFIKDYKLHFTNVAVPKEVYEDQQKAAEYIFAGKTDLESLNYHTTYDIFSTPQIYLLDKNKKIIAKKLDAELLKQVLDNEFSKKNN